MIRSTTGYFPLVSSRVLGPRPGALVTIRRPDGTLEVDALDGVVGAGRRLASVFLDRGVRPGDVVGAVLDNGRPALEALLGIPMTGAVFHPLNAALSDAQLAETIERAGDRAIVCDVADEARIAGLFRGRAAEVWTVQALQEEMQRADPDRPMPRVEEDHPFALIHTSGTTGRPKAVVPSHRAVWLHALAAGLEAGFGVGRCDTVLSIVPAHHALAIGLPLAAALHGASLVLPGGSLGPAELLDVLVATGTTRTGGLSSGFAAVLDALDAAPGRWPLRPGLRIVCGGNALHRSVVAGFARHGVSMVHTWGMTETGPLATTTEPLYAEAIDPTPIPQGRAVPLVEVRVVDAAGRPAPWDGASEGELQVRGAWTTDRYAFEADDDAFAPGGWLRTGDRATLDPSGVVRLVGRIKEGIRVGDRWIGPATVEACLRAHPHIADVAVIGLPDRHLGERPLAVVVLRPDAAGGDPQLSGVRGLVPDSVLPSQLPIDVRVASRLPRGPTGKVDRVALREESGRALGFEPVDSRGPSPVGRGDVAAALGHDSGRAVLAKH